MSGIKLLKLNFESSYRISRDEVFFLSHLRGSRRVAFISLCVMQALVFITGFSGMLIYKVQRISNAHYCRIQALSDRSLLIVATPIIHAKIDDLPIPVEKSPLLTTVTVGSDTKKLLVNCIQKTDTEKILRIAVLNSAMQAKSCAYLLFTKSFEEKIWTYRGIQFGDSL